MNSFLPKDYKAPVSEGNYFKFKQGENTFRILSSAIVGFQHWTKDNKPVRTREALSERPDNAKVDDNGNFQKHFWAFVVYNYDAKKPQIMEITQRTLQQGIGALSDNAKWGDVKGYDIVVNAKGEGLEREYSVLPEPKSDAPKVDISKINLNALFDGADPFSENKSEYPTDEGLKAEDVPF
jgi:hypothetical protein